MLEQHQPKSPHPDSQLNSYLDGQLSSEERLAFETQLSGDKGLSDAVELQNEIDASLARTFTVPSFTADDRDRLVQRANENTPTRLFGLDVGQNQRFYRAVATIAACFALVFVGWSIYDRATDDGYRQLALEEVYSRCVSQGFQPDWVCADDRQFADTFARRQGQALLLRPITDGSMVGLAYLRGLTRNTTAMLARVEDQPILVFVDRIERDTIPAEPSWWSGLHLFRKEIAGLVMYEISPLAEPRVMDAFYVPSENQIAQ